MDYDVNKGRANRQISDLPPHSRQLINLVPIPPDKSTQPKSARRIVRNAIVRRSSRRNRPASARRGLQVEDARMVVILALAEQQAANMLVARQRNALRRAARASMHEARAVRHVQHDGVKARRPAQGERRARRGGRGGQRRHVREVVAVRPAPEVGLAEAGGDGPVEGDKDGVVVRQDGPVGLQEVVRVVPEGRRGEAEQLRAAVEELVDGLAGVRR